MANIGEQMLGEGIQEGSLVKVVLEDHAGLDHTGATIIPSFFPDSYDQNDNLPGEFEGSVAEIKDDHFTVVLQEGNKRFSKGSTLSFYEGSVKSYKVK